MSDRFNVQSFAAVGSVDFACPRQFNNWYGSQIQIKADGNFSLSLHADNFGDGSYADVTSLFTGAGAITAAGFYFLAHFIPGKLNVSVDSVQSTKHVQVAVGF